MCMTSLRTPSAQARLLRSYVAVVMLFLAATMLMLWQQTLLDRRYQSIVDSHDGWRSRADHLAKLAAAAAPMNAAINDVFQSRNSEAERARALYAHQTFRVEVQALTKDLEGSTESMQFAPRLAELDQRLAEMEAVAELVFDSIEGSRLDEASHHMAEADQLFSDFTMRVRTLQRDFRSADARQSTALIAAASNVRRLRSIILVSFAAAFLVAMLYARSLGRQLVDVAVLKEHVEALSRSEQALRASDERFQLAAQATRDAIWDWDLRTNQVWINDVFRDKHYPELCNNVMDVTVWYQMVHPDDVDRLSEGLESIFSNGSDVWQDEYRLRTAAGQYAVVLDRARVIRDEEQRPVRLVGSMADLTDQKAAEAAITEAHGHLRALSHKNELILDTVADGILGLDGDSQIVSVNQSALRILQERAPELIGRRFSELMPEADLSSDQRGSEGCRQTGVTRSNGSGFTAEYSISAVREEGDLSAVVTFRDVTDRLAIQKMKHEFVSIVSHELRTPLTSIRGSLGLLQSGLIGTISERGHRMLDIAVSNTDRLVRLINDILDIERMESGQTTIQRRKTGVQEIVQQAIDVMQPMAEKASIELGAHVPLEAAMWADPDRVLQTLTNLISNAIKFSPAGTKVSVSAIAAKGKVVFQVRDQGRGIPADKVDTIFERFQQLDASDSREKGGSGLGLTICRSIVQQHGGEIWVTSGPDSGSEFSFSIPHMHVEREAVPVRKAAIGKLLVCDDDPSVREVLTAILERHEYEVIAVADGRTALQEAERHQPDAILLDLVMPDWDGWQTLAALRASALASQIPVLIVSVLSREEAGENVEIPWIRKPLDEATLLSAIANSIAPHRAAARVVLVEDDTDLAGIMSESFERHGIEMIWSADGREALDLIEREEPDLIVLDIGLPDVDGFEVVRALRSRSGRPHTPLIVYSARELNPDDRQRLQLGPTQFFTKSRITPAQFEAHVVRMLDRITPSTSTRQERTKHVA